MRQEIEIWCPVVGYEGLYEVSSLGRVKSLTRTKKGKCGSIVGVPERILKYKTDRDGYLSVTLSAKNKRKMFRVHRLVAETFIPNPDNLPQVNHKDENPANNTVENLEWCSVSYNINYGNRNKKVSIAELNRKDCSKPIVCVELNKVFPSIREAVRFIGKKTAKTAISSCCSGITRIDGYGKPYIRKTAYGYHWRYA